MATPANPVFQVIPGLENENFQISTTITTPGGLTFTAVKTSDTHVSIVPSNSAASFTLVATGTGVPYVSLSGVVGDVLDGLNAALKALAAAVKALGCTPTQTVTQQYKGGQLVSQTITNTCVPN